ncbi:MAG: HEAT repeat domain-containing protein [Planctomycetes bacterium]|nr:HEAT repeat domain-containing protein [Planctomycetota bacterium]
MDNYPIIPDLLVIQTLKDGSDSERMAAAKELGNRNAVEAIPALVERLSDYNERVAVASAEALAVIGGPIAFQSVLETYRTVKIDMQLPGTHWVENRFSGIVSALVTFLTNQQLIEWLQSGDDADKRVSAITLGMRRAEEATVPLRQALCDPNQTVRSCADWALAELNKG